MKESQKSSPEKSVTTKVMRHIEERNPYKFIEKTLQEAKNKLEKMKGTPQLIETLSEVK